MGWEIPCYFYPLELTSHTSKANTEHYLKPGPRGAWVHRCSSLVGTVALVALSSGHTVSRKVTQWSLALTVLTETGDTVVLCVFTDLSLTCWVTTG